MRWAPTVWGWLLILVLGVASLVLAGWMVVHGSYDFLNPTAPAARDGGPTPQVLIVEGWLSEQDLDVAIDYIARSPYRVIVTAGGPIETFSNYATYAARAADYLREHGLTDRPILAAPAPGSAQERTYLSAIVARDAIREHGWDARRVDVYTLGVHTRRTWYLYRLAFGDDATVGVIGAEPHLYEPRRWWTTSMAFKVTMGELLSIAWTACCFEPGERGSPAERWGPDAKPRHAASAAAASPSTSSAAASAALPVRP